MLFSKLIGTIISHKLVWGFPGKSDVLILDNSSKDVMLKIFSSWSISFINTRDIGNDRKEINVVVVFRSVLKVLFDMNLFDLKSYYGAYVDSYINMAQPKLLVTYIDNNRHFYSISARNESVKTMFIQNSTRYYYGALEYLAENENIRSQLKVDYMCTLGVDVGDEYYGKYIQGKIIPIGSLKNNMIPNDAVIKKHGTIAFSSQYRQDSGKGIFTDKWYSYDDYFNKPTRFIVRYLIEYAKKNGKEFFVIPCSKDNDGMEQEFKYYKKLVGEECSFSRYTYEGFDGSYYDVDSAEVLVTLDCTMGYECIARGGKNAFFPIRSYMIGQDKPYNMDFGWPREYPNEGPFWSNIPNTIVFDRILDHLFLIDDFEWKEELKSYNTDNIITYDPGNSVLQSVLEIELGKS
jgi:surface carbohydrate biosynthesis protein